MRTGRGSWILLAVGLAACSPAAPPATDRHWGIGIHGGAGTFTALDLPAGGVAEVRADMERALMAGHAILARGGSSLDAVQAAIVILEDSPNFNAGKGAVFTRDGKNELDAAIMDGRTLGAGAVAGLHHVKNPVLLARRVMENSPHVMMVGDGAEEFARQQGIEMVPPSYFRTEQSWQELQRHLATEKGSGKKGTVGAVALDQAGNLAAGTSTGGLTGKRWGRVGDVPIIGAGTYANNRSCAVSATGVGEFFIRNVVAHSICTLVEHRGMSIEEAADAVVIRLLGEQKGEGGVIAMDRNGNFTGTFNSQGMLRGHVGADGKPVVSLAWPEQP